MKTRMHALHPASNPRENCPLPPSPEPTIRELERRISRLETALKEHIENNPLINGVRALPFDAILFVQKSIACMFDLGLKELLQRNRSTSFRWPRQLALHFCVHYDLGSFEHIADQFGMNHTNVMHADEVVRRRIADPDSSAAKEYAKCKSYLDAYFCLPPSA